MGRLDIRRLLWGVNRWFLVHGVLARVSVVGAALLLGALWLLVDSSRRHAALEAQLEGRAEVAAASVIRSEEGGRLPFPVYAERFALTTQALEALRVDESLPGSIAFRYDRDSETGFVRQTATFAVNSRWEDLGGLLDQAQSAIPTAYISRLQLSRDTDTESTLRAEVQFTLVFVDAPEDSAR